MESDNSLNKTTLHKEIVLPQSPLKIRNCSRLIGFVPSEALKQHP